LVKLDLKACCKKLKNDNIFLKLEFKLRENEKHYIKINKLSKIDIILYTFQKQSNTEQ